jgi:hypothetical protein
MIGVSGGGGGTPGNAVIAVVWDNDLQAYAARPANATVVRYVGPVEPSDWTAVDEWRTGYGTVASADLLPSEITGLVEWLEADALTLNDNDAVATWTATVGNNATQGTEGNRPLFKTNVVNSLPAVRFDGTNDILSFAALGSALTQFTVFAVVAPSNTALARRVLSCDAAGFSNDFIFGIDPEEAVTTDNRFAAVAQRSNTSDRIITYDSSNAAASWEVYVVRYDGSDLEMFRRSGAAAVGSSAGTDISITNRAWHIGGDGVNNNKMFAGDMAELGVFSTAISDADVIGLMSGLCTKYGLAD